MADAGAPHDEAPLSQPPHGRSPTLRTCPACGDVDLGDLQQPRVRLLGCDGDAGERSCTICPVCFLKTAAEQFPSPSCPCCRGTFTGFQAIYLDHAPELTYGEWRDPTQTGVLPEEVWPIVASFCDRATQNAVRTTRSTIRDCVDQSAEVTKWWPTKYPALAYYGERMPFHTVFSPDGRRVVFFFEGEFEPSPNYPFRKVVAAPGKYVVYDQDWGLMLELPAPAERLTCKPVFSQDISCGSTRPRIDNLSSPTHGPASTSGSNGHRFAQLSTVSSFAWVHGRWHPLFQRRLAG